MPRPVLVDGRGNAREQVIAGAVRRGEGGIGTGTVAKGRFLIAEAVAIVQFAVIRQV